MKPWCPTVNNEENAPEADAVQCGEDVELGCPPEGGSVCWSGGWELSVSVVSTCDAKCCTVVVVPVVLFVIEFVMSCFN